MSSARTMISVRLNPGVLRIADDLATALGWTRTAVIETALFAMAYRTFPSEYAQPSLADLQASLKSGKTRKPVTRARRARAAR